MTSRHHVLLGLFFVAVFGILGWFTLFKTDFSLFAQKHLLTVHFQSAGGLREGDPVLVAGLRWGEVQDLIYDPQADVERRVTVLLSLEQPVQLFADHRIAIEDATVLGGKQLAIEPGLSSAGAAPEAAVRYGAVTPNVMQAIGELVSDNGDSLTNILEGIEQLIADMRDGRGVLSRMLYDEALAENLSNAVTSVSTTFDNAQALTDQLRQGEGTIGKLMYDTELYEQIKNIAANTDQFMESARVLADDVRAGKGTIGALLSDEETRQAVTEAIDHISNVAAKLDSGEGTLGMLLTDPEIGKDLAKIVDDLAEGHGTLGKLISEDAIYSDLRQIADDLKSASAALRDKQGTIGRLLYDDAIYADLERAVRTLTGSLEEAREAAPIATFLNTVFLGF